MRDNDNPLQFEANGGKGPLLLHVKAEQVRDFADDDVRSAMAEVGAREQRERYAADLGADGVRELLYFNDRVKNAGPNAAKEYADYVSTRPRPPATPKEEARDEPDDHMRAARAAYRSAEEKANRAAEMPAAHSGLDRFERNNGSLEAVGKLIEYGREIRQNPNAWQQVAHDIAGNLNANVTLPPLENLAGDFIARNKVSDEELAIMMSTIPQFDSTGDKAADLAAAHAYARYVTAPDIKDDPHKREVIASMRAQEGPQMFFARQEVADWDRRHPNVSTATRNRMQSLLEAGKAQNLDHAYEMVKR